MFHEPLAPSNLRHHNAWAVVSCDINISLSGAYYVCGHIKLKCMIRMRNRFWNARRRDIDKTPMISSNDTSMEIWILAHSFYTRFNIRVYIPDHTELPNLSSRITIFLRLLQYCEHATSHEERWTRSFQFYCHSSSFYRSIAIICDIITLVALHVSLWLNTVGCHLNVMSSNNGTQLERVQSK